MEIESIQNVRDRMQILNKLVTEYKESKPFSGITVLFIQHQLINHYALASAFIELGLDPKKLYWIDIPYTSNFSVREALIKLGVDEHNLFTNDYHLSMKYAEYQRKAVQNWINDFLPKIGDDELLLVLDDGAYFLEAIVCFKNRFKNLAIVEQTSHGIKKIEKNASIRAYLREIPLINVAESKPKTELESEHIGRAIVKSLMKKVKTHPDMNYLKGEIVCLILGYGNIGSAVANFLSESLNTSRKKIFIYDSKEEMMLKACQDGFPIWNRDDFSNKFDLVIGCSGESSFTIGDHIFLKDEAYLASASSGASELSRESFIELADTVDYDDVKVLGKGDTDSIHEDIHIQFPHARVTFLNGGFPMNFDGITIEDVPARYIQITTATMVQGAIQAVSAKKRGIIDFHVDEFFEKLIQDYKSL